MMASQKVVTPVKTGVQRIYNRLRTRGSDYRQNDGKTHLQAFYEIIKNKMRNTKLNKEGRGKPENEHYHPAVGFSALAIL